MVTSQEQQSCGFYDQSQGSSSIPFVGSYQYFSSYVVYYIYILIIWYIDIYFVHIYIYTVYLRVCFPSQAFWIYEAHPTNAPFCSTAPWAPISQFAFTWGNSLTQLSIGASHQDVTTAIIDPSISISLNVLVIQVCKKKQKKKEVKQSNTWSTSPFLPFWGNVSTRPRSPAPRAAPMAATPWQLRGQLLLSPGAEKSGPKGRTNLVFPCLSSKT